MANNCLVTKLKSVVDNDNLLKLNEGVFAVFNTNSDIYIRIGSHYEGETIELLNAQIGTITSGAIQVNTTKMELTSASGVVFTVSGCTDPYVLFKISNKYKMWYNLDIYPVENFAEYDYCLALRRFIVSGYIHSELVNFVGNLSSLKNCTSLSVLKIQNMPLFTGDVSVFSNHLNFSEIELGGSGVTGDISVFGMSNGLTKLTVNSVLRGSIENLVAKFRSTEGGKAAKTTGTLTVSSNNVVTFNTVTLDELDENPTKTVQWTSSTITVNGTTINA